jgi:hypothetical protein
VAVYLVTVKGRSGSHETSELEADQYYTNDDRVTFWSSGLRSVVSSIIEKPD